MRIPPYWVTDSYSGMDAAGQERRFYAWGWSFESEAEARKMAREKATRIFNHIVFGKRPDRYPYLTEPLREEIIDTLKDGSREIAVITRNRYGALILNAASVFFADIDYPEASPSVGGFLKKLFGGGTPPQDPATLTLEAVKTWAQHHPQHAFRLYRTKAGLRLLFTDKRYDPASTETANLLKSLGSDRMYQILTEKQATFRARLTPKPWRCNFYAPTRVFPSDTPENQSYYRQWVQDYQAACVGYRACELVESIGATAFDNEIAEIVQLHDKYACNGGAILA